MSRYESLPRNEKTLFDLVTMNANMDKNIIDKSPMFPHCKGYKIELLHDDIKAKLCTILLRN